MARFAEADLQQDLKKFPFNVVEAPDGGILVELMYGKVWQAIIQISRVLLTSFTQNGIDCEPHQFTPEQLLAMLFINLR